MSNSASSGNAALPSVNVGGYHRDPSCDDELGMDTDGLKVGSIIRYWTDRLMVDYIDWDKEVVCASCAMGKEFEIPFGEFDIIR